MDVEKELEELRELLEENIELTKDTNRVIRKMRRSARWAFWFQILWWALIAAVSGAAYYYYVQPYVQKIENLYSYGQNQTQNFNEQITDFLKFFNRGTGSSTPSAQ